MRSVFYFITFFCSVFHVLGQPADVRIYEEGGLFGLSDSLNNPLIPAEYEAIGWSDGSNRPISNVIGVKQNNLWGLTSLNKGTFISPAYTQLYPSKGGFLIAAKKGKYSARDFLGLLSVEGKEILPFRYNSISVSGLRAIVSVKSGRAYQYGLVDLGGKTILPLNYAEIKPLGNLRYAAKSKNGQIDIFDDSGRLINEEPLDGISSFKDGYAKIFKNHLVGLLNIKGEIKVLPDYKDVKAIGGLKALPFDTWEFIDGREVIKSWNYDNILFMEDSLYKVSANGYQWVVNQKEEPLTSISYEAVESGNGTIHLVKNNGKWGALKNYKPLIDTRFDSLIFENDLLYAYNGISWSLYDVFGIKKTAQEYEQIKSTSSYYFAVKKRGKWGFIDRRGEEIIHCVYEHVGDFNYDKVVVKFHNQYGVINKTGEWVVLPQPDSLKIITPNLYLVVNSRLTTLKSFEDETIYFTSNRVEIKTDHMLEYLSDGGLWKIDFNGRIVNRDIPQQRFKEIRAASEGLFAVKYNNRFGFVDNQNRLIVANRYEDVGDFSEGLVAVKLLGKWGYIDRQENIIIQPKYTFAGKFKNDIAIVKKKKHFGLINSKGQGLSEFYFDHIEILPNGNYLVTIGNKKGLLRQDGKLLINAKYDYVEVLENGFIKVSLFNKFGILTPQGLDNIPIIYEDIKYDARTGLYLGRKKSQWEKLSD